MAHLFFREKPDYEFGVNDHIARALTPFVYRAPRVLRSSSTTFRTTFSRGLVFHLKFIVQLGREGQCPRTPCSRRNFRDHAREPTMERGSQGRRTFPCCFAHTHCGSRSESPLLLQTPSFLLLGPPHYRSAFLGQCLLELLWETSTFVASLRKVRELVSSRRTRAPSWKVIVGHGSAGHAPRRQFQHQRGRVHCRGGGLPHP